MSSWRYKNMVSREARVLAKQGMYKANVFVDGIDAPSVYPSSVREVLEEAAKHSASPSPDPGRTADPEPCDPAPSSESSEEPLSDP